MKKWIVIAVLVAIAAPVLGARQTVVRTDLLGTGWTKQNSMNTELYQKTDPTETGFTGMDGAVITSGVVPSAKNLSPDKTSGVPSINFLYEANGTDTNGFGFLGPLNSSKNILYRISDESPTVGNVFKVDSIATDQTITVGSGSIVADVVTLILAAETGGGGASFVEQADDPTSSSEDGYFYGATTSGDFFYKSSTGLFNITAGTYTADPTTPTLVSLTIPAAGTTATAVFSEAVSYGAGGAGGWTLNSPTNAMTYASGTGTDTIVFNLASTILSTDTPTVSYTQPTNGFESSDEGVDLASITNAGVTNNSTQVAASGLEDTFTDTDSTLLTSHTSDSGHTWTQNGGGALRIYTNRVESSASNAAGLYYPSFTPTDADYSVQMDLTGEGERVPPFPAVRCSSSAATMYGVRWNGTTTWELTRWVSGTRTVIGTYVGDSIVGTTRTVKLTASGTTISVDIGGVNRIAVTDSTISSAGTPGIGTYFCEPSNTYHGVYSDNLEVTD